MERATFRTETAADFRRRFNTLDVFLDEDDTARPILEFGIDDRQRLQVTIHRFGAVSRLDSNQWQRIMALATRFYEDELGSEAAVRALMED